MKPEFPEDRLRLWNDTPSSREGARQEKIYQAAICRMRNTPQCDRVFVFDRHFKIIAGLQPQLLSDRNGEYDLALLR
jgi:hypothetical protein